MSSIEFIRDRASYYNCPVCGRNLRGCEVRILNHQDERFTVQVTCGACRVSQVVVLAIQNVLNEGAMDDALPEDDRELAVQELAAEEMLTAKGPGPQPADPIEADEVLEVHLLLKDFQGSFDKLLKTPHR